MGQRAEIATMKDRVSLCGDKVLLPAFFRVTFRYQKRNKRSSNRV
jgi:hypothetical protein